MVFCSQPPYNYFPCVYGFFFLWLLQGMKREMIWGLILQDVIPAPDNLRQAKPWMAYVMWRETHILCWHVKQRNDLFLINIYVRHKLRKIQSVNGGQIICHGGGSMPNRNGILSIYFRFSSKASSFLYWLFFMMLNNWSLPNSCLGKNHYFSGGGYEKFSSANIFLKHIRLRLWIYESHVLELRIKTWIWKRSSQLWTLLKQ